MNYFQIEDHDTGKTALVRYSNLIEMREALEQEGFHRIMKNDDAWVKDIEGHEVSAMPFVHGSVNIKQFHLFMKTMPERIKQENSRATK